MIKGPHTSHRMLYVQNANQMWTQFYPITSRDFLGDVDKVDARSLCELRAACGDALYGKYVGGTVSYRPWWVYDTVHVSKLQERNDGTRP